MAAKQLTFTYGDTDYVLEFTRNSVRQMESNGFIAGDLENKPMTVLPDLFAGAFIAHHRFVKRKLIDEIYGKMKDKASLIERLTVMYNDTIESMLFDEPEEGNLEWTPSW